jgi:serine/threonine protein kinase
VNDVPPPGVWPAELVKMGVERGDLIGEGGFAWVFRAQHPRHGPVAVKLWRQPLGHREEVKFRREWSLHRALASDPHIVRMFEAVAPPRRRPWTVSELYECSLQDRLRDGPPIGRRQAFALADDLLAGLAAVHRARHLHRDVKPANVLLRGGRAALGDLGILLPVGDWTLAPGAGTASFRAPELAPELVYGHPSYRSDVYSAAMTIRRLFDPADSTPPRPIDALLESASSELTSERPADAAQFRARLLSAGRMEGYDVEKPAEPEDDRPWWRPRPR